MCAAHSCCVCVQLYGQLYGQLYTVYYCCVNITIEYYTTLRRTTIRKKSLRWATDSCTPHIALNTCTAVVLRYGHSRDLTDVSIEVFEYSYYSM